LTRLLKIKSAFYQDHALFDDFTGVVLDTSEGQRIANALGNKKAVILRNHGLLQQIATRFGTDYCKGTTLLCPYLCTSCNLKNAVTVGHSVDEAAWWFTRLDQSWNMQLSAEAAGKPIHIPHEVAEKTQQLIGTHEVGRRGFQHFWEEIIAAQPDLLN
jgi:hypothetical protein